MSDQQQATEAHAQRLEAERDRLAVRAENAEADYAGARRHVERLEAERDRLREERDDALHVERAIAERCRTAEAECDRLREALTIEKAAGDSYYLEAGRLTAERDRLREALDDAIRRRDAERMARYELAEERDREQEARIAFEKEALRYRRELTEAEAHRDRLARDRRDLRAVVWGAAVLIREHRVTQAAALLEDSIPEGYVPAGAPNQPGGTHAQDPDPDPRPRGLGGTERPHGFG